MKRRYLTLIFSLALVLSLVVGAQVTSADEGVCPGCPDGRAKASGPPLTLTESFTLRGGYVAAGIGMRNLGYGNISISGIPLFSTIRRAYLYWTILNRTRLPAFANGNFDGNAITGAFIGTDRDPCWAANYSWSYRADVTSFVTGNGSYSLTGFTSGATNGQDPFIVGSPLPMLEGASLVVVYSDPGWPCQTIVIYDGNDEFRCLDVVNNTLSGFTASSPVHTATITFLGADGQAAAPDRDYFNGNQVSGENAWDGSDPQAVPDYSQGNLWDTDTYDVTALVSPGDTSATATADSLGGPLPSCDCMVWVAVVFAVSAETDLCPSPPVGGEVYPANRISLLAPWIALAAAIIAGASIIWRRRRA